MNLADNEEYTEVLLKVVAIKDTYKPTPGACLNIQNFLVSESNILEEIKKEWDDLFKEKEKLSIIKTYLELQLEDVKRDLNATNRAIIDTDQRYLMYKNNKF